MSYSPIARFNPNDSNEVWAKKLNDELLRISRTVKGATSTVVIASSGTGGSAGGGSTTSNIKIGNVSIAVGTNTILFSGALLEPYSVFIFFYDSNGNLTPMGNRSVTTSATGFTLVADVAGTVFYIAGSNA